MDDDVYYDQWAEELAEQDGMPVMRTPAEWSAREGIVIVDPDGWRHDRKSMDEPIHHDEWVRRKSVSTVMQQTPQTPETHGSR